MKNYLLLSPVLVDQKNIIPLFSLGFRDEIDLLRNTYTCGSYIEKKEDMRAGIVEFLDLKLTPFLLLIIKRKKKNKHSGKEQKREASPATIAK